MKGLFRVATIILLISTYAKASPFFADDSIRFIKLQLIKDIIQKDETVLIFKNNAKMNFDDNEDSRYFQGIGQVRLYSFVKKEDPMVFNTQPFPASSSVTSLYVYARTDGAYKLKLSEINNVPPLFNIWLVDNLLKDSIDLRHNSSYSFNISKADTNTFGGNRLKIIIKRDKSRDFHLLSFTVNKLYDSQKVQIKWTAENENNNTVFTVERSNDKGKTFKAVDSLISGNKGSYSLTDKSPAEGINLYRLKQHDFTDNVYYSTNLPVDNTETGKPIVNTNNAPAVYPNPVNNLVNVAMSNKLPAGNYSVAITNIWGLKVKQGNTNGQQWQSEVGDLKPGTYMVTITNITDNKIVGYNKFLKK
ncbi:MAG: T9SS type A sorting domain-containing protein [Bacteroidota bacterium]